MSKTTGNKYKLLELLATGGMGEIWLARQTGVAGFDRLVVVKKILPHLTKNKAFLQMFLDEARLAARLTHPNIAQIHDLARTKDGGFFISLEFVHGEDLAEIMQAIHDRRHPGMPLVYAVKIISSLCEALRYAHNLTDSSGKPLGIIHRDVSPANVLVSYQGQVKVVDFGIAKAASNQNVTRAATVKGKRGYMSPEQAMAKPIDHRADIFAVGVILWELLTGRRLYASDSDLALAQAICSEEPARPTALRRNIPKALENITMRALAKDPADRFQDCQQIHIALERFLHSQTSVVTPSHLSKYMTSLLPERVRYWQELLQRVGVEAPEAPWQADPTDPFGAVTSPKVEPPEDDVDPAEEDDETKRVTVSPELLASLAKDENLEEGAAPFEELGDLEETRRMAVPKDLLASMTDPQPEDEPSPLPYSAEAESTDQASTDPPPAEAASTFPEDVQEPTPTPGPSIVVDDSVGRAREQTPREDEAGPLDSPRSSSADPSASAERWSPAKPEEPPESEARSAVAGYSQRRPLAPAPAADLGLPEDGSAPDPFADEDEEDERGVVTGEPPAVPIESLLEDDEDLVEEQSLRGEHSVEQIAEVICSARGVVLDSKTLRFPAVYEPRRKVRLARMGRSALKLRVPPGATGRLLRAGAAASGPEPLNESKKKVQLRKGDRAELSYDGCTYRLRVKESPLPPREARHPLSVKLWTGSVAGAIALHGLLFLSVMLGESLFRLTLPVADPEIAEQFADVEIPPPPPPPPPPEKKIIKRPPPKPDPSEAEPQIPERLQRRIQRRMAPTKTQQSSAEELAQALRSPVAGEGETIEDVVSNIDAVAGQGSTSLDIHGTLAGIEGDEVQMARGGGGDVGTLDGKAVASKGAGKVKGRGPTRKVRGRVQNVRAMTKVRGTLDRSAVAEVVERHSGQIQACYERELLQSPSLSGRVTFEWQIRPNGRVANAREQVSTLGNPKVSRCILQIIRRMQFPRPDGGSVTVAYPFMFRSVDT